ncbi:unnamed protein product [Clonostachys rhizophaga]|uniref:Uncharacterized protein n=1 Tax=Clonostachys rhizophaga TaxID=160324 RepID=A0A9N9W392_9HYPO|nr:unnamed protein product [Clonostachys rhizophaga]
MLERADTGAVTGWDDTSMLTVAGVRRRDITASAVEDFITKQGPSRNITAMEWGAIWAANKAVINPIAPRYTTVSSKDLVKVTAIGVEAPVMPFTADRLLHPKNKDVRTRKVVFASEMLMDQASVKLMRTGEEITLMGWGNAFMKDISSTENEKSVNMTVELNLGGDFKKTDKKVT